MASASSRAPYPMPVLPTCPECGRDSAGPPPSLGKRIVVALVLVMLLLGAFGAVLAMMNPRHGRPSVRALPSPLSKQFTYHELELLAKSGQQAGLAREVFNRLSRYNGFAPTGRVIFRPVFNPKPEDYCTVSSVGWLTPIATLRSFAPEPRPGEPPDAAIVTTNPNEIYGGANEVSADPRSVPPRPLLSLAQGRLLIQPAPEIVSGTDYRLTLFIPSVTVSLAIPVLAGAIGGSLMPRRIRRKSRLCFGVGTLIIIGTIHALATRVSQQPATVAPDLFATTMLVPKTTAHGTPYFAHAQFDVIPITADDLRDSLDNPKADAELAEKILQAAVRAPRAPEQILFIEPVGEFVVTPLSTLTSYGGSQAPLAVYELILERITDYNLPPAPLTVPAIRFDGSGVRLARIAEQIDTDRVVIQQIRLDFNAILALLPLAGLLTLLIVGIAPLRQALRRKRGECLACGYDLKAPTAPSGGPPPA